MKRSEVLQGIRMMRFEEIYNQYRSHSFSCENAAELLGTSVSSFYRMRRRYEEEGFEDLLDRRPGRGLDPSTA
ncbi:MAG: helix-turn-helix domain-containing protein [Deltaproteobacteria bacterium]|nr:helix-turn-helix domain-containing protein [Deltaproteobacteria bacterium]MBW2085554.1 helix-turn-helix domain-containing protein [Deltaproteobacteria bacterium]